MVGILAGTVEDALITSVALSMSFFLQEVLILVSQFLIFQYFNIYSYAAISGEIPSEQSSSTLVRTFSCSQNPNG